MRACGQHIVTILHLGQEGSLSFCRTTQRHASDCCFHPCRRTQELCDSILRIVNCLCLLFRTQGRFPQVPTRRLKPFSYRQETRGQGKALVPRGCCRVLLSFTSILTTCVNPASCFLSCVTHLFLELAPVCAWHCSRLRTLHPAPSAWPPDGMQATALQHLPIPPA